MRWAFWASFTATEIVREILALRIAAFKQLPVVKYITVMGCTGRPFSNGLDGHPPSFLVDTRLHERHQVNSKSFMPFGTS